MPPKKKNDEKIIKQSRRIQQALRPQKVVKPKLKTPSIVKVKIPSSKPARTVSLTNTSSNPLSKNDIKIQLSNEVALAALGKPDTPKVKTESPKPIHIVKERTTVTRSSKPDLKPCIPPKKRGRKKKVPEPICEIKKEPADNDSETPITSTENHKNPSPKTRGRCIKKTEKKEETVSEKVLIQTTTSENPKMAPKLIRKRSQKNIPAVTPAKKPRQIRGKKINHEIAKPSTETPLILKDNHDSKSNTTSKTLEPKSGIQDLESSSSRRTSTLSECLSWTKEISSSSTTTCVTVCSSADFFRIDNKLPVIKLNNMKHEKTVNNSNDALLSDSDSSSSSASSTRNESLSPKTPDLVPPSPNLSISSISQSASNILSPRKEVKPNYTKEQLDNLTETLKNLQTVQIMMKNLDHVILNLIGYADENTNIDNINRLDKSLNKIPTDYMIEKSCLGMDDKEEPSIEPVVQNDKRSATADDFSSTYNDKNVDLQLLRQSPEVFSKPESPKFNNDADDDALSLYAESLTGIESSKLNSSVASIAYSKAFKANEEYVPESLIKTNKTSQLYQPTKISECNKESYEDVDVNNFEEYDQIDTDNHTLENCYSQIPKQAFIENKDLERNEFELDNIKPQPLCSETKTTKVGIIFQNICVFNLRGECKRSMCRFLHIKFTHIEFKNRLLRLSEYRLIQEYMYVRKNPILRGLFALAYAEEFDRRKLTRGLIEMAVFFLADTSINSKAISLQVEIVETVLMHLNTINLNQYESHLLQYIRKKRLCCHFMQIIGETQNFSRFKNVFVSLTDFLVSNNIIITAHVTSNILDRVAILSLDETVAKAAIKLMKISTNLETILNNPMISKFETQLAKLRKDLYIELQVLKADLKVHATSATRNSTLDNMQRKSILNTEMYAPPDSSILNGVSIIGRTSLDMSRPQITITNDKCRFNNWRQSSFNAPGNNVVRNQQNHFKSVCKLEIPEI